MIDRICISINNRCNLRCRYCHFREKSAFITPGVMDFHKLLGNVCNYIDKFSINPFKIGFVGNGEPLLDFPLLKSCVEAISEYLTDGIIRAYTITNGTLITEEMVNYLFRHRINIGFSLDGPKEIHDYLRGNSFDLVMSNIEMFRRVVGSYPSINVTVGREVLNASERVISFLKHFDSRITFSRMIGIHQISLDEYRTFVMRANKQLNVRSGGLDCTMYGGRCGAGINNFYFANGKVWLCGNCVDLSPICDWDLPLDQIPISDFVFDRNQCYREQHNV